MNRCAVGVIVVFAAFVTPVSASGAATHMLARDQPDQIAISAPGEVVYTVGLDLKVVRAGRSPRRLARLGYDASYLAAGDGKILALDGTTVYTGTVDDGLARTTCVGAGDIDGTRQALACANPDGTSTVTATALAPFPVAGSARAVRVAGDFVAVLFDVNDPARGVIAGDLAVYSLLTGQEMRRVAAGTMVDGLPVTPEVRPGRSNFSLRPDGTLTVAAYGTDFFATGSLAIFPPPPGAPRLAARDRVAKDAAQDAAAALTAFTSTSGRPAAIDAADRVTTVTKVGGDGPIAVSGEEVAFGGACVYLVSSAAASARSCAPSTVEIEGAGQGMSRRSVAFIVRCPRQGPSCRGRAAVFASKGARRKLIARGRVSVAPGHAATVRVPLTAAGRRFARSAAAQKAFTAVDGSVNGRVDLKLEKQVGARRTAMGSIALVPSDDCGSDESCP